MKYTLYADGACSGNPGPGGWSWNLYMGSPDENFILAEESGGSAHTTNNIMEMEALSDALRDLSQQVPGQVDLCLDSEYVLKGLFEWMDGWKRRGWKGSTGKPVANLELWKSIDAQHQNLRAQGFRLFPKWVRGHAGDPYNERVDRAACAARDLASGKTPKAAPTPKADQVHALMELADLYRDGRMSRADLEAAISDALS